MSTENPSNQALLLADPPRVRTAAPAVSVIIPTYNRADLIDDTVDSVAAQTFRDYEIIVVDDGSQDDTRTRLKRRTEPLRYLWQTNQGVAEARNHALREVHSEFVAFLDSDDLWTPTFLEAAVGLLRRDPGLSLVYTRFISMDERGRPLPHHNKTPYGGDVTRPLFLSTFIHTSAVVARSHVIRDAGGFDGRLTHNEDYDLWLRLSLRHRFGLIPDALCRRRCHPDSLAHNGCTPDILLRKAQLLEHFYERGGGDAKVEHALAHRRLAKVYYTAGKALCRASRKQEACETLRQSLTFDRGRLKTWLWYARSSL